MLIFFGAILFLMLFPGIFFIGVVAWVSHFTRHKEFLGDRKYRTQRISLYSTIVIVWAAMYLLGNKVQPPPASPFIIIIAALVSIVWFSWVQFKD